MAEQQNTEHIPEWRLADRLRRALDDAGMGVREMADYLGVSRKTVGNWINGHVTPGRPELRLWALRTGVPLPWLQEGKTTEDDAVNSRSAPDNDPYTDHAPTSGIESHTNLSAA